MHSAPGHKPLKRTGAGPSAPVTWRQQLVPIYRHRRASSRLALLSPWHEEAGRLALDSSRGQHVSALGLGRTAAPRVHARNGRVAAAAVDASCWAMQGTAAIRQPPAAGLEVVDCTFDSERGMCVCVAPPGRDEQAIHNSAQARRWCAGPPLCSVQCAVCGAARPCPRKARPGGAHTEGEGTVWVPSHLESSQQPRPRLWACYWLIWPICACRCLAIPGATLSVQGPSSRRARPPGLSLGYTTCVCVSLCVHHTVVVVCLQSAFPFHLIN